MKYLIPVVLLAAFAHASPASAQTSPDNPDLSLRNVRFDIVLTDDTGSGKPLTKTVTMHVIAAPAPDGARSGVGQIRSSARPAGVVPFTPGPDGGRPVTTNDLSLNIDITRPMLQGTTRVRTPMAVDYRPYSSDPTAPMATIRASVDLLLTSGVSTVVSQTADPITDRRVTIAVTATILP